MKKQLTISRTPSAEAFTALILEIFRFNGQLLAAGDRLTKTLGLSSALWQVLGAIDDAPSPMSQIARNMGLTRQSVRRSVHVLKEKGFVEFKPNPDHRRAKLVILTRPGHRVLRQVKRLQIDWSNEVAEGIDDKTIRTAIQIMKEIEKRL